MRPWICTGPTRAHLHSCRARFTSRLISTIATCWRKSLTERKGRRVHILAPQRGEKRDMIDLVEKNAKLAFEQRFRVLKPDMKRVLEEMQETLELPRFPARIESFDISHIQGAENVAGMVVCDNGKMNRNEYRKFKIRWVEGANDFASMHEAVLRRYRRVRDEEKALPDLIMIDGGKAQLSAAAEAMRELDLEAVPMIGVVKPPLHHNQVAYLLVKGREDEPHLSRFAFADPASDSDDSRRDASLRGYLSSQAARAARLHFRAVGDSRRGGKTKDASAATLWIDSENFCRIGGRTRALCGTEDCD